MTQYAGPAAAPETTTEIERGEKMVGIIAAAMAAAGDAGVQSMNQNIQQLNQQDLDKQRADMEIQKQLTIIHAQKQATIDAANQMRQERAGRIDSALDGVASEKAAETFADHDAAVQGRTNTGTPLTPQQQAVINSTTDVADANRPAAVSVAKNDAHSYILAAMRTGDIEPHMVAQLAMQEDATRRQEAAQKAQFDHADASQLAAQEFSARQLRSSQNFQAGENDKSRTASAEARALDPAVIESNAQAIASGRLSPLSGSALRSPGASAIMARALEINPNLSAKDYQVSLKAEKDFGTGSLGKAVRSFNVALSHLDTLDAASKALNNGDTQVLNKIKNTMRAWDGAPEPTNFDAVKHIVADEIVKAVVGSAGALGDRQAAEKTLQRANSPEQLAGVVAQYKELMVGQLHGLRDQYKATTGKDDFDTKYLSDAARAVAGHSGAGKVTTVPNLLAQPSGGVLTYDPKTGTFH